MVGIKNVKCVFVVCRGNLEGAVPIMNVAQCIQEMDIEVKIVCSRSNEYSKQYFNNLKIEIIDLDSGYKTLNVFL